MILRSLGAILIAMGSLPSCDQTTECGDINTLELASPSPSPSCFGVTYTCTSPSKVIQSTACGNGYSDFALEVDTNATCTLQVSCADGTTQTISAQWTLNSRGCAPVLVSGPFDHTVCGGDGGVLPEAAVSDATSDAANDVAIE